MPHTLPAVMNKGTILSRVLRQKLRNSRRLYTDARDYDTNCVLPVFAAMGISITSDKKPVL